MNCRFTRLCGFERKDWRMGVDMRGPRTAGCKPHTTVSQSTPPQRHCQLSECSCSVANQSAWVGGPAATLFISRDACSNSIAKLFCACFYGISQNYRAVPCKMAYRTAVPARNEVPRGGGGYRTILGECKPPLKSLARYAVSHR